MPSSGIHARLTRVCSSRPGTNAAAAVSASPSPVNAVSSATTRPARAEREPAT